MHAFFSTRISTCSPSLVFRNWPLLNFSVKTNSSICYHFLNIRIIFCRALHVPSRSCRQYEYKPGSTPEPLALKAPLITWSVQWLLLQCAAALQRCMEQTLWSRLRCWGHWYFTHFKLFYFPNIIGLVLRTAPLIYIYIILILLNIHVTLMLLHGHYRGAKN